MHDFHYRQGELYCEDVPLSRIAKEVGTPCYVYSHHTLVRHFRVYDGAFKNIPHIVAFAMKANSLQSFSGVTHSHELVLAMGLFSAPWSLFFGAYVVHFLFKNLSAFF